jgi:hypothetical protein
MKTIKLYRLAIPSWMAFFLFFGFLSGMAWIFFLLGKFYLSHLEHLNIIRPLILSLPFVFSFFYIVFGTYLFPRRLFQDIAMYLTGCFAGVVIFFVISLFSLLFTGLFLLFKLVIGLF